MAEADAQQLVGPQLAGSSVSEPRAPRPGYAGFLTPEDRKLLQRVEERLGVNSRQMSRWALERQYFECVAFYLGIQWIEYMETGKRWVRAQFPSWFPTPTSNALKPRANGMISRLLRSRPQGRVRPESNEIADRQAADVGEKMIQHIYDVTNELEVRQLAAVYAVLTGTVIAEDYFNPKAGMARIIPRTKLQETPVQEPKGTCATCNYVGDVNEVGGACPQCGGILQQGSMPRLLPDGTPAIDVTTVPELDPETLQPMFDVVTEGEIESRMLMLFNFFWDPKASTLKDAQWCGEVRYVDLDWIDMNFPDFGPYVAAQGGIEAGSFFEASLLSLVGPSVPGTAHYGGLQQFTNGAVLMKYQEKPSQQLPRGLHMIVANGVILYKGDLPVKDQYDLVTGDFTYTEFRYDIAPGRFPGSTPVEDMVALQRRINGIDSQVILNRKTMMNPWLLAPKGSGLNPGNVAMRPGATVLYNFVGVGAAPQVVQGTPLPETVYTERQKCLDGMDELAEDPRVSSMTFPQNTRSGVALHWLKEQVDEFGVPRLERWAQWIAARDRKRLLLAQRHYREQRAIRLLGEGRNWEIRKWAGSDLAGNTDVVVDPGTLVPRSRSAQTQIVFDAVEAGIIDLSNPVDKQKVIEELQLGRFESDIGPDRRHALMENAMMDDQMAAMVNPEDNHDIHALEHLMVMKDPSFTMKDQMVQKLYRYHLAAHHEAKAMLVAATQQGAPAPAGEEPRAQIPTGESGEVAAGGQGGEGPVPPT